MKSKSEIISELKKNMLDLSELYDNNIRLEVNVSKERQSVSITVSEINL